MKVEDLCKTVLDLDEKATPGKWELVHQGSEDYPQAHILLPTEYEILLPSERGWNCAFPNKLLVDHGRTLTTPENDAKLIVDYRTSAPLLARALLRAKEALSDEAIQEYISKMKWVDADAYTKQLVEINVATFARTLRAALRDINEMVRDKK